MMWQPPSLFTSQNVSVDSRITHYIVSITSEDTANISIVETPEISLRLDLDNESCRFSFQVAAVNPAGIGEHSHPQIINCEFAFVTYYWVHLKLFTVSCKSFIIVYTMVYDSAVILWLPTYEESLLIITMSIVTCMHAPQVHGPHNAAAKHISIQKRYLTEPSP